MTGRAPAKNMRSFLYLLMALLFLLPLCSSTVLAKDMLFVPRASVSVSQYEFTKPTTVNGLGPNFDKDFPEVSFDLTYKVLGVGGTLFKNNYYFDLFYQQSSNEEATYTVEVPDAGELTNSFDGRRRDFSFTFGKKILDGRAAIYAGYKEGKTGGSQSLGQHLSFEEDGFFIGGNYGWFISDIGVISLNLAYAKMDGNRTQKSITGLGSEGRPVYGIDLNGNGDANGLSYGATWSSRLTEHLSYSVGLEVRQYTFDNIKDVNPNRNPFTDEVEETFSGITFSTYYSF
jgi:hypothetical protein